MKPSPTRPRTLKDVAEAIGADPDLPAPRRSELRAAINTFCKIAGRDPSSVLADPSVIRTLLEKSSWQLASLSKRSWANVKSRLAAGLKHAGIEVHRRRINFALEPDWEALLARLEQPNGRRDLTRFAGWCSALGVKSCDVSQAVFERYLTYLNEESLIRNPRERWHVARRAWNKGVETVPGWPTVEIENVEREGWRAIPWSEFPSTLQEQLSAYAEQIVRKDPFDEQHRAIKPVSVRNYLESLKWLASKLVEDGVSIDHFDNVRVFLDPALVKRGLRLVLDGREEKGRLVASSMAHAVLSIAKYLGLPKQDMDDLKKIAKKVRPRLKGMCERNKVRLASLEDENVLRRFLSLPLTIARRLKSVKAPTVRDAQEMQLAVALEILLKAPMRVRNLAELDLECHLTAPLPGTDIGWRISIKGEEVKNGVELDFILGPDSSALIDLYLNRFRPVLGGAGTSRFFVSQTSGAKGPSALSKQLQKFIKRELGIQFNAHLVRHFAAFLYLRQHPGEYETVRRLLGHKAIETTLAFYCGSEEERDRARYDALITGLRQLPSDPNAL